MTRACNSCRVRKVRCDHARPSCSQCRQFSLPCIVLSEGKRKNPVRGRLIAQARGEDELQVAERQSTTPPSSMIQQPGGASAQTFSGEFFYDLLPQYEQLVFPVNPIVTPRSIVDAIANMEDDVQDMALICAYGSVTIFLAQSSAPTPEGEKGTLMDSLMQRSLEAHRRADLNLSLDQRISQDFRVSIKRIMTCIFLEISMMAFRRLDRSFVLLREAIAMIQMLATRDPPLEDAELAAFRRAYWEAYIHERFLTLSSRYPSILPALKTGLPVSDATLPRCIETGFNRIISIFLIIDDTFLQYWLTQEDMDESTSHPTLEWLESKQTQLDEDETAAFLADQELRQDNLDGLSELQQADLLVTRLWMRTLVWQLALSRGLLQSSPMEKLHIGLSLQYPARRLTTQLRDIVSRLESLTSIRTQGSGIAQKLFEITSTAADVLALPLAHDQSQNEDTSARVEGLVFLAQFVLQFGGLHQGQKDYLREKVESLSYLYPTMDGSGIF